MYEHEYLIGVASLARKSETKAVKDFIYENFYNDWCDLFNKTKYTRVRADEFMVDFANKLRSAPLMDENSMSEDYLEEVDLDQWTTAYRFAYGPTIN